MASKVRTYSRAANKDQTQQRLLEDPGKGPAINPVKAEKSKWGDTSFVRVREDDPFEVTYKKVKVENETLDPFTFDLEEDGSVSRAAQPQVTPASNPTPVKGLGRPAISNVKVSQKSATEESSMPESPEETEMLVEDLDKEPTMLKRPVRTYSRGMKKDVDSSADAFTDDPVAFESVESEEIGRDTKNDIFSNPDSDNRNIFDDDDDDVSTSRSGYRRTRSDQRTYSKRGRNAVKETTTITSKTHILQSEDDEGSGAGPTVLNFRSQYMDPAIYSNFKYTPQEEDPVGRMNNSKVLQSSEIKHGKGSTLIVICSPKPPAEGRQTLHPVKTYKVKGSKIQLVDEENDTPQPVQNTSRVKREVKAKVQAIRAKRPRRKKDDEIAVEQIVESTSPQNTEDMKPPVLEVQVPQPVRVVVPQRVNKIFRSRNKVDNEIKESPPTLASDILQAAALDSQIQPEIEQFTEPGVMTENMESSTIQGSDDMFGFGDEIGNEGSSIQIENTFAVPQASSTTESQVSVEGASQELIQETAPDLLPESSSEFIAESSQETEMETEETGGSSQDTNSQELKSSQNSKPKAKRIVALQDQEGEVESLSSEGEFDSSQEMTSDNPNSQGETKATKNRKFFKSKSKNSNSTSRKIFQSPKKSPSKAVYNVRSWHDDFDEEDRGKKGVENNTGGNQDSGPPTLVPVSTSAQKVTKSAAPTMEPPRLTRAVHWPDKLGDEAFTSVHVTKEHKQLYTVVKNVKEAHECQEHGETQDFSDDIEYLLAGLKEGEPMSTRCLSCIGLAQKSIMPAFRMHLRAHGTVAKMFGHLQDSVTDPSLALCTALLMFMLSRDKLNMDLDRQSLDLMLKLLGVDVQEEMSVTLMGKRALNRNKDRVKEVYDQWRAESGIKQSEMADVSTGILAMESLLSLTSRRAGEWFKEELRTLGALDHIVDTVCSCIEAVDDNTTLLTDSAVENLKKIDRCLRVLENISYVNTENQTYLISYKTGALLVSLCRALAKCEKFLPVYPFNNSDNLDKDSTGYVIYNCCLAVLRVLLNITHENEFGCTKVGEQMEFICTVLTCILQTPQYVPLDYRFDILVLSLGLLINMVEHCSVNRRKLMDAETLPSYDLEQIDTTTKVPATKALVQVFCKRFEVAKKMEEQDFGGTTTPQQSPNKSGEWRESDSGIEWVVASGSKTKPEETEDTPLRLRPPQTPQTPQGDGKNNDDDEDTFTKALSRAGKHMENSIVASYVALLLGCLIQDNTVFVSRLKEHLPNESFDDMITILKKFLGFMNLTTAVGSSGGKSIAHVIEVLEGC